jgi:glycine cleavage system aminomethyltransferase T
MDLLLDDDPLEAGLAFSCKQSPVAFLGCSALQLKRSKGLNKRIDFFIIDE